MSQITATPNAQKTILTIHGAQTENEATSAASEWCEVNTDFDWSPQVSSEKVADDEYVFYVPIKMY